MSFTKLCEIVAGLILLAGFVSAIGLAAGVWLPVLFYIIGFPPDTVRIPREIMDGMTIVLLSTFGFLFLAGILFMDKSKN